MTEHAVQLCRGLGNPLRGRRCAGARLLSLAIAAGVLALAPGAVAQSEGASADAAQDDIWSGYLDYAYVYSSAESGALRERLASYGNEAGVTLERYLAQRSVGPRGEARSEANMRRTAIGNLLVYRASGDPDALDRAIEIVDDMGDRLSRHENRYWYHYIHAHRALERDRPYDFAGEILELWLKVVVPLEAPYEALETLSLSDSPNSGFVSALPYVYENIARMILIETQQVGMNDGLDPLGAVVRLLADGRIGANPDVVPRAASAVDYVERIVSRLDGPESDAGSLTFTLSLFEAAKYHDQARGLLATDGFSADTVKAVRVASKAYEAAMSRSATLQGRVAVYTRVLRQLGEIYVAKQRLGEDPDLELPFTIEGAMALYNDMVEEGSLDDPNGWRDIGYRQHGRDAYVMALHTLWQEIQETTLNAANTYLAQAVDKPHRADEASSAAARLYSGYLDFFESHTSASHRALVPDSAYFSAYEAALGFGDSIFDYMEKQPTDAQMHLGTVRYRLALGIFPFDTQTWPALAQALERQGRESDYLQLVRPLAERFTGSRSVDTWIADGEAGARQLSLLRKALSEDLVVMYLGFANERGLAELEAGKGELATRKQALQAKLQDLKAERGQLRSAPPASPAAGGSGGDPYSLGKLREIERSLALAETQLQKVERQIAARERALPLFRQVMKGSGLSEALQSERNHPIHLLLRRMYHEGRQSQS